MTAIFIILIPLAVFMLMRANPQRRRVTAQQQMLKELGPGDRVVTASGMIGTLLGIDGDRAAVEAAPGVVLEFLLPAIVRRLDENERVNDAATEPGGTANPGGGIIAGGVIAPMGGHDDAPPLDIPDDLSSLDEHHEPDSGGPSADAHPADNPDSTTDEGRDTALDTEPRAPGPEES
jgi:preprotein translocase subunit YajC